MDRRKVLKGGSKKVLAGTESVYWKQFELKYWRKQAEANKSKLTENNHELVTMKFTV